MEMLLDMVNLNIQEALKKFQGDSKMAARGRKQKASLL
jgi:hypothetical protein